MVNNTLNLTDWTHKNVKIKDVRKNSKMYILQLEVGGVSEVITVTVQTDIFEEQLVSYYLCDASKLRREDILAVEWNMVLSKGYYIKIAKKGLEDKKVFTGHEDKWFVSYLKVTGGLGTFDTIYK